MRSAEDEPGEEREQYLCRHIPAVVVMQKALYQLDSGFYHPRIVNRKTGQIPKPVSNVSIDRTLSKEETHPVSLGPGTSCSRRGGTTAPIDIRYMRRPYRASPGEIDSRDILTLHYAPV